MRAGQRIGAVPRRLRVALLTFSVIAAVLGLTQGAALAAVTVSPNTNLPDSASVNVSGNGFTANQPGTLQECRFNPSLGFDECKVIGTFTTGSSGNFGAVPVNVTRTFTSTDSTTVTCVNDANPCRVLAILNNVFGQQEAQISFSSGGTTAPSTSTSTTLPTTTTSSTTTSTTMGTTTSSTTTSTTMGTTTSSTTTSTTMGTTTSSTTTSTTMGTTTSTSTTVPPPQCPPPPPPTIVAVPGMITVGTPGDDVIYGTEGDDRIAGLGGNDMIFGFGGNDQISGGDGDDIICGGEGNDQLLGGAGNDVIFGDGGNDDLSGGTGNDRLFGGAGVDRLVGAEGNDSCAPGGQTGDVAVAAPSCDTIT